MKTVIVVPARYASERLPGKPLLKETGQYLIEYVYKAALKSKLADEVIVATDDDRIYKAVESFGGKVEMTSVSHKSGTDRMYEVATRNAGDIFVNVQGDEPDISPLVIDQVITLLIENEKADVATLCNKITYEEAQNPNVVKAVLAHNGFALYFSRSVVPYKRDQNFHFDYLGHIGIYAYRRLFLEKYVSLKTSELENIEKLEQLRVLENGYNIVSGITNYKSRGIDTLEDYKAFIKNIQYSKEN